MSEEILEIAVRMYFEDKDWKKYLSEVIKNGSYASN